MPPKEQYHPHPSSERELQIIGPKRVVLDCCVNDFVQELRFPKEVLSDPKPESERLNESINKNYDGGKRSHTGVEQIMWSYGTMPSFHQQSTIASRLR